MPGRDDMPLRPPTAADVRKVWRLMRAIAPGEVPEISDDEVTAMMAQADQLGAALRANPDFMAAMRELRGVPDIPERPLGPCERDLVTIRDDGSEWERRCGVQAVVRSWVAVPPGHVHARVLLDLCPVHAADAVVSPLDLEWMGLCSPELP